MIPMHGDFEPGFGILSALLWALGSLFIFLVVVALLILLVRFLIIGTQAAQLYLANNGGHNSANPGPKADSPAGSPAKDALTAPEFAPESTPTPDSAGFPAPTPKPPRKPAPTPQRDTAAVPAPTPHPPKKPAPTPPHRSAPAPKSGSARPGTRAPRATKIPTIS